MPARNHTAAGGYVEFVTRNGQCSVTCWALLALEGEHAPFRFLCMHRCQLVDFERRCALDGTRVTNSPVSTASLPDTLHVGILLWYDGLGIRNLKSLHLFWNPTTANSLDQADIGLKEPRVQIDSIAPNP
jgi:endogenous inhibitor of DNA gyrase (YacG/DUF329 family)